MRTVSEIYKKTFSKDTSKTSTEIKFNNTNTLNSLMKDPLFKQKIDKQGKGGEFLKEPNFGQQDLKKNLRRSTAVKRSHTTYSW